MTLRSRHSAFTLVEMLTVVAIMTILIGVSVPAVTGSIRSQRRSAAQTMVSAAISLAKAHAAKTSSYAGLRFQPDINGRQYIVLIEKSPDQSFPAEFLAVDDYKPQPMPKGMAAITGEVDLFVNGTNYNDADDYLDDVVTGNYGAPSARLCFNGARTFTLVFSPTGSLVVRNVEVASRANDLVFGNVADVEDPAVNIDHPLLYNDTDTANLARWRAQEPSTTALYLYEQDALDDIPSDLRYSNLFNDHRQLDTVTKIVINAYTGTIINPDDLQ